MHFFQRAFTFTAVILLAHAPSALRADFLENFDPNNITLSDPSLSIVAELPSGNIELKTYEADQSTIRTYGLRRHIPSPDLKDNPKAPHCTRAEFDVLKRWVGHALFEAVNRTIRLAHKGKVHGLPISLETENDILVLSSAVNCAPQYSGRVVRRENTPSAILEQYTENKVIFARAFTSTSKGTQVPNWFKSMQQEIVIEDAEGSNLEELGIAEYPDEHEVLIRPGAVFKVLRRQYLGSEYLPSYRFSFGTVFTP